MVTRKLSRSEQEQSKDWVQGGNLDKRTDELSADDSGEVNSNVRVDITLELPDIFRREELS